MKPVMKVLTSKVATYAVAAATTVAAGIAATSAISDYNKSKETMKAHETSMTLQDIDVSDKTKTYSTLLALGLLGTGVAANKKKKLEKQVQEIEQKLKDNNLEIQENTIILQDQGGAAIKYSLEGYSAEQLTDIALLTLDENYQSKLINETELNTPEIKALQAKMKSDIKYSTDNIAQRILEKQDIDKREAQFHASIIHNLMEGKSDKIKEEYINVYLSSDKKSLYYDNCRVLDPFKINIALLASHGITVTVESGKEVEEDESIEDDNIVDADTDTDNDNDEKDIINERDYEYIQLSNEKGVISSGKTPWWNDIQYLDEQIKNLL